VLPQAQSWQAPHVWVVRKAGILRVALHQLRQESVHAVEGMPLPRLLLRSFSECALPNVSNLETSPTCKFAGHVGPDEAGQDVRHERHQRLSSSKIRHTSKLMLHFGKLCRWRWTS